MEHFTSDGVFWLPYRPDRRVPGTLTFDPDGLAVRLHDSLHAFEAAPGKVTGYSPNGKLCHSCTVASTTVPTSPC